MAEKTWSYYIGRPKRAECKSDQDHKERQFEWADVLMNSDGMFAATSDYGDFVYRWAHYGHGDFRNAFLRMSVSSFLNKTRGGKQVVQLKETIAGIKKTIVEYRRSGEFTTEEAREELALIKQVESEHELLHNWLSDTSICDAWEFVQRDFCVQDYAFAELILPRLDDMIRAELIEEQSRRVTTPVC